MVSFRLVGVGPGESGHGPIQLVGTARVARDHGRATGCGRVPSPAGDRRCRHSRPPHPELFRLTRRLVVETTDESSCTAGTAWWEDLTAAGGEGMVVKPFDNLVRSPKGLAQPGLKVRGREYLRIIYGADYTNPSTLTRIKQRNLGQKRSMALREYALGLEAIRRAVAGEPVWRIHQCVFGVLAMESELVDPRL